MAPEQTDFLAHLKSLIESSDHTADVVPIGERRSSLTMGLLWITMITGFPQVLIGFQFYKNDITLPQVFICTIISCLIVLAYAVSASYLGAKSGQTYGLLSRNVFGRWGSRLVTINFMWLFLAWYGVIALMLADALKGLLQVTALPVMWLAFALGLLMAVNNFFGFTGIANFARFIAAPILIAWVGYTFFKALVACPVSSLTTIPHKSFPAALSFVSMLIIGPALWGNEADYWRYGKPKIMASLIPLAIALLIGQFIFPITGWMVAQSTGITDYAAATAWLNQYCFGNIPFIAVVVLTASYFAINDSQLYGLANALENLRPMPHKAAVGILAVVGAALAAWLSLSGSAKSLESVASLSSAILTVPTVIMVTEWLLQRLLRRPVTFLHVPQFQELPAMRWPAFYAWLAGSLVGIATSGILPASEFLCVGICALQSWLVTMAVYISLRLLELKQELAAEKLTVKQLAAEKELVQ